MTKNVNSVLKGRKHRGKSFRSWVQEIWMENCEERLIFGEDPVTMQKYWNTYKYWLKREYKHRNPNES